MVPAMSICRSEGRLVSLVPGAVCRASQSREEQYAESRARDGRLLHMFSMGRARHGFIQTRLATKVRPPPGGTWPGRDGAFRAWQRRLGKPDCPFRSRDDCPELRHVPGFLPFHLLRPLALHDEEESFRMRAPGRTVAPCVAHGNVPRAAKTGRDDVGTVTRTLVERRVPDTVHGRISSPNCA